MKVRLMFPNCDFDPDTKLPVNAADLAQDLEMEPIFAAMDAGNELLGKTVRTALFSSAYNDLETILWRQGVLRDCLENERAIHTLFEIALEPVQLRKSMFLLFNSHHPSFVLSDGRRMLEGLHGVLMKLSTFASNHQDTFQSQALRNLCAILVKELDPEYLAEVKRQLKTLNFHHGLLFSARLGPGSEGQDLVPHAFVPERWAWLRELLGNAPPHYCFSIDPRDESGVHELGELQDAVLVEIAHSTVQAAQHVETFFTILRTELAFYIGCLNLHRHLADKNIPVCFPEITGSPCTFKFKDLRDASLSLLQTGSVVGNDLEAWATPLIMITGANQGGKSTFLRSIGLAQIMMQAGMFATAQYFAADLRDGIITHYRRREDQELNSGKFDEELRRISKIIDHVGRAPLFLFNESFAATNEREGSEVARQIITALVEQGGHVVFVTHMYALAEAFQDNAAVRTCFLLAERGEGGRRSFRILPGTAQATSFGRDLYWQVFGDGAT